MRNANNTAHREPRNDGKIVGQKAPFKVTDIWALRVRFHMEGRVPWRPSGYSRHHYRKLIESTNLPLKASPQLMYRVEILLRGNLS